MVWVLLFSFGISGMLSALNNRSEDIWGSYFETPLFENQIEEFIDYLSRVKLDDTTKEEMKKQIVVTKEEINEYRYRYGSLGGQVQDIKGQYDEKVKEAEQKGNKELLNFYINERDKKIEDITNNFKSDEYVKSKIIKEKEKKADEYYRQLENDSQLLMQLEKDFKYYLKDITTAEVYTNLDEEKSKKLFQSIKDKDLLFVRNYPGDRQEYISTQRFNVQNLIGEKKERTFEGKIAVFKSTHVVGNVLNRYNYYQHEQKAFYIYIGVVLVSLLLSVYLYKHLGIHHRVDWERWRRYYRCIPIDIAIVIFMVIGFITLLLLENYDVVDLLIYGSPRLIVYDSVLLILISILIILNFMQGKFLFQRVRDRANLQEEWKQVLLYKVFEGIKRLILTRSMMTQIVLFSLIVFGFGVGLSAGVAIYIEEYMYFDIYIFLAIITGLPSLWILTLIANQARYFDKIMDILKGNLDVELPVLGNSTLAILANNINTLKKGVEVSQKEQIKSERLKTELITNVSHDLRTPLTSIITYAELLQTSDIAEEERQAYIQIIDRKSKRLKVLIDDLFEASKMASGNIELAKEKVDLVQLLEQALAEHNEAMNESTLQFRITTPDKPIYAVVDGQKVWRVFDNLIGNVLKYSLEGTRVYIAVEESKGKARIVFKNIAKYELNQDIDELFERFKRGDTSRHTEGSGLGLAIAKSIIDLHGGSLEIEVDGDLFKIVVIL